MNLVGSLSISARYADGRLSDLAVQLERPPVARLFLGQTPEVVVRTVPRLFTLCSRAQAAAAQGALAAATAEPGEPVDSTALWLETLHEHFWRLLLDWPLALGLPQARDAFIAWRNARSTEQIGPETRALLEKVILGQPVAAWRENGRRAAGTALAGRCMRQLGGDERKRDFGPASLTPDDWLAYWRGDLPGEPEVARPHSIAAAWRVRLEEALEAGLALEAGTPYPVASAGKEGWGIGLIRTARGILAHGARVESGRVSAYRVWAPTDRHFADAMGISALLGERSWPDIQAATRAVEQAVLALDPCLPYTVKVENA